MVLLTFLYVLRIWSLMCSWSFSWHQCTCYCGFRLSRFYLSIPIMQDVWDVKLTQSEKHLFHMLWYFLLLWGIDCFLMWFYPLPVLFCIELLTLNWQWALLLIKCNYCLINSFFNFIWDPTLCIVFLMAK